MAPGWLLRKVSSRQFILIGAIAVGLWAGLTAVLLKVTVHYLQEWLVSLSYSNNWIFVVSPALGIGATYLFVKLVLKGDLARGTSQVLFAIAKKSSFLSRKEIFSHAVTSALTVGMGGSAGLESPIVQTGSAIGSTFASIFPVGYRVRTLLLACGAAAGIATAFNAPIAGVLFAIEVLLVDISASAFIPLLIAGATGALCSKIILAEGILFSFKHAQKFNYHNVPYYVVLGIVCGLISVFYVKSYLAVERIFHVSFRSNLTRLLAGSMLLGGLILLMPALFGEGYASIKLLATLSPDKIFGGSVLQNFFLQSPWILGAAIFLIGITKSFAVSLTLNSGGNGGNFAPALLVGACVGFSFAFLINTTSITTLPAANFCLVAMAGTLTGIFHAPLTGIFLIAEITGGYDLIIPLMIVAAISVSISRYLSPKSLDEEKLSQSDGTLTFSKEAHVLSEFSAKNFVEKDFAPVHIESNLRGLTDAVAHSKRNVFPVVNDRGSLHGVINLEDVREMMFDTSLYDSILVKQLMQKPVEVITVEDDMNIIMEKFDKSGVWNLPVLDEHGKYLGFISKSRILSNYRERLRS
jgi:CIC family chloride channel protein